MTRRRTIGTRTRTIWSPTRTIGSAPHTIGGILGLSVVGRGTCSEDLRLRADELLSGATIDGSIVLRVRWSGQEIVIEYDDGTIEPLSTEILDMEVWR